MVPAAASTHKSALPEPEDGLVFMYLSVVNERPHDKTGSGRRQATQQDTILQRRDGTLTASFLRRSFDTLARTRGSANEKQFGEMF